MLGIDKKTLVRAITNADVEIFTEVDMESLFTDIGKDCSYTDDGAVEFDDVINFIENHKKEDDDNKFIEINGNKYKNNLSDLEKKTLLYGPTIVCKYCSFREKCKSTINCRDYANSVNLYDKLKGENNDN